MGKRNITALLLGLMLLLLPAMPAVAGQQVKVKVGKTVKIALPRLPKIIGMEDPSIATIRVTKDGHALVRGVRPGRTRIVGRDFAELPFIIPVTVTR